MVIKTPSNTETLKKGGADIQLSSGGFALGETGVFEKVVNRSDKEFLLWIN